MAETSALGQKMMEIDLIREKILYHAIFEGIGTSFSWVNRNVLTTLRLVHPTWTDDITRILRREKKPLFLLILNEDNSRNESDYVKQNGKLLDQFVDAMTVRDSVPTFRLELEDDFFRDENVTSLMRCWSTCADSLVELEIHYPLEDNTFYPMLPRIDFPNLQIITITPHDNDDDADVGEYETANTLSLTNLLHSVLTGVHSLTRFILCEIRKDFLTVPTSFKYLNLPSSLTTLELTCRMNSDTWEALLVKTQMPNLKNLDLLVFGGMEIRDGLLFQVLDNFKGSLKSLGIYGTTHYGSRRQIIYLGFPVMKKLTSLTMDSIFCELDPELFSLERCFPELEDLYVENHTSPMLHKWTRSSKFPTVTHLAVGLVNENFTDDNDFDFPLGLDALTMQQIQIAFPNVTKLDIRITPTNISGIHYIFTEMTQLTSFGIRVLGTPPDMESDFWDSILIGVPIEMIAVLEENPDSWKSGGLQSKRLPGLQNLKQLKEFELIERSLLPPDLEFLEDPLISDLAFTFSLLKLHNLTTLYLGKRFMPSRRMENRWRELGRKIGMVRDF